MNRTIPAVIVPAARAQDRPEGEHTDGGDRQQGSGPDDDLDHGEGVGGEDVVAAGVRGRGRRREWRGRGDGAEMNVTVPMTTALATSTDPALGDGGEGGVNQAAAVLDR